MSKGYWKLVERADGFDTHRNKYVWVEQVEEEHWSGTMKTVERETNRYSYGKFIN